MGENTSRAGEVRVRHAGSSMGLRINSRRHPGDGQRPSYRWTVGKRYPGDDKTGMTGRRVDFRSTNSEPLGLEPTVVQFSFMTVRQGTAGGRVPRKQIPSQ